MDIGEPWKLNLYILGFRALDDGDLLASHWKANDEASDFDEYFKKSKAKA